MQSLLSQEPYQLVRESQVFAVALTKTIAIILHDMPHVTSESVWCKVTVQQYVEGTPVHISLRKPDMKGSEEKGCGSLSKPDTTYRDRDQIADEPAIVVIEERDNFMQKLVRKIQNIALRDGLKHNLRLFETQHVVSYMQSVRGVCCDPRSREHWLWRCCCRHLTICRTTLNYI